MIRLKIEVSGWYRLQCTFLNKTIACHTVELARVQSASLPAPVAKERRGLTSSVKSSRYFFAYKERDSKYVTKAIQDRGKE